METCTVIDKDGDLKLIIGKKQEFQVCSRSLARVSPVFKRMLFGGFQEAKPTDPTVPWVVTLPEDYEWSASLLLSIAHSDFNHVPEKLSLEYMYHALVFSEKYDLTSLLNPWIRHWLPPRDKILEGGDSAFKLGISWELGDGDTFVRVAKQLCLETTADKEGRLTVDQVSSYIYPCRIDLDGPLHPPDLNDNIMETRSYLLGQIFKHLSECVSKYQGPESTQPANHQRASFSHDKDRCCAMILGGIVRGLEQSELRIIWKLKDLDDAAYSRSVNDLVKLIKQLAKSSVFIEERYPYNRGDICNPIPDLVAEIDKLLASPWTPVTEENVKRLRDRWKKHGSRVGIPSMEQKEAAEIRRPLKRKAPELS